MKTYVLGEIRKILIHFGCKNAYSGSMTHQPWWVILSHLPEAGRKGTKEQVDESKDSNRQQFYLVQWFKSTCTYRIQPYYRTVRLGFSKMLGKLMVKYVPTYTKGTL